MARKEREKVAASEPSAEFKAFEDLAKMVLGVPKTVIDEREAEFRKHHHGRATTPAKPVVAPQ
jgi:hypothetical protein